MSTTIDPTALAAAIAAKTATITIQGRQASDTGNEYFAYAIYASTTPGSDQYELLTVADYPELGSETQLQYQAAQAFSAITGITVERPNLTWWGRENGINVSSSVEELASLNALNEFLASVQA